MVNRHVTIWDVDERRESGRNTLLSHPASVAFSPDGSRYAVKNTAGAIVVCDLPHGEIVSRYTPDFPDEGCAPAFSADGRHIVDGTWGGRLVLRRTDNLAADDVEVFPDAMIVAVSASADHSAWAIGLNSKPGQPEAKPGPDRVVFRSLDGLRPLGEREVEVEWLRAIQLSPDGSQVGILHGQGALTVVSRETTQRVASASITPSGTGWALEWSPDGKTIATVERGAHTFFSPESMARKHRVEMEFASRVAFSPDRRLVALGSWKGGLVMPIAALPPAAEPVPAADEAPE